MVDERLSKDNLEILYETMSVGEIAEHLGIPKSTVYYHIRRHKIARRSRSDAQKQYQDRAGSHPREGTSHSAAARRSISEGLQQFWDSDKGQRARQKLSRARKKAWTDMTLAERQRVIERLTKAPRARRGELSGVAQVLYDYFLEHDEVVLPNVQLTQKDRFDIVLEEHRVAIKIIPIMSSSVSPSTNDFPQTIAGYIVIPYQTRCSNMSFAECSRIHKAVLEVSVEREVSDE